MHHVKDSVKEYSRIIATGLFFAYTQVFYSIKIKNKEFQQTGNYT